MRRPALPPPHHRSKEIQLGLALHARTDLHATVRDAVVVALSRLLLEAGSAMESEDRDDAS